MSQVDAKGGGDLSPLFMMIMYTIWYQGFSYRIFGLGKGGGGGEGELKLYNAI